MEPHRKTLVDQEQRRPESAHGWWEPKAELDPNELINRSFKVTEGFVPGYVDR
jgi:hypothetical protein